MLLVPAWSPAIVNAFAAPVEVPVNCRIVWPVVVVTTEALTPVLAPLIASATPCAVSVPTVMWVVFPPIVRSRPLPVVTAPPPELVTSAVVTWDWASAVTLKV